MLESIERRLQTCVLKKLAISIALIHRISFCSEEYRIIEPNLGGVGKLEFNMTSLEIPYFVYIYPYFVFFYLLSTNLLLSKKENEENDFNYRFQ